MIKKITIGSVDEAEIKEKNKELIYQYSQMGDKEKKEFMDTYFSDKQDIRQGIEKLFELCIALSSSLKGGNK